jgi:hypothetical protein
MHQINLGQRYIAVVLHIAIMKGVNAVAEAARLILVCDMMERGNNICPKPLGKRVFW